MKIVWISHSGTLGGAEKCLWEAAKGIVAKGHEVHAVLPARGTLVSPLESASISVSVVPYIWWAGWGEWRSVNYRARRLLRNLFTWPKVLAALNKIQPDLVVTNTISVPSGALAARWADIPHVWYIHEFGQEDHNIFFDFGNSLSFSLIDKLSDKVVVNSAAVLRKFQPHISSSKLRLIYYAVDTPLPPPEPCTLEKSDKAFKLVLVGLINPGKRQEEAIQAVSLLHKKGLDMRLTLVGSRLTEYELHLRRLVQDTGIERLVDFVAFTDNPFPYVASADVALMCSQNEAFGRVTVEAMKLGKPVIGANSAGTAELIQDGITGLLYQSGDAEDLARKVETLYYNHTLLAEMSKSAQQWSNQMFTSERYTTSLLEVFEDAIADHRQRSSYPRANTQIS